MIGSEILHFLLFVSFKKTLSTDLGTIKFFTRVRVLNVFAIKRLIKRENCCLDKEHLPIEIAMVYSKSVFGFVNRKSVEEYRKDDISIDEVRLSSHI